MISSQGEIGQLLTVGLVWMAAFWITYFPCRLIANRPGKIYTLPFLANMLLGVYIFLIVQPNLLNSIGVNLKILNILGIVMSLALISHHISEEGEYRFKKSKKLRLIHHQISHLVFFIAFALSTVIISTELFQKSLPYENSIILTYLVLSLSSAFVGIMVGVNKIKLVYA